MKNTLKIPLIVLLILFVLFGGIGTCSYKLYEAYKNFPEHAEKEVVYTRYSNYLATIDTAIENSTSPIQLAAQLENLERPDKLIYLALEKETEFDEKKNPLIMTGKHSGNEELGQRKSVES